MTSRKRLRELSLNDMVVVDGEPVEITTISSDALFPEMCTVWLWGSPRIDGQKHDWVEVA